MTEKSIGEAMAISQMALIQSLGEAMAWFEKEVEWGVPPTELRHLCGRIGELFVAVLTNGQMANAVNQKGYDVVGSNNEQISVKTTATVGSASHVSFNAKTLLHVHRVIVLRINTEEREIETLLDAPIAQAMELMGPEAGGKRTIALSKIAGARKTHGKAKTVAEVNHGDLTVRELESGTIEVLRDGVRLEPAKPVLRIIAEELNIGLLNGGGNPHNTRQLGSLVIKAIAESKLV